MQLFNEMNDGQMKTCGWSDRAWWVVQSVFLLSPEKGSGHV